MEATPAEQEFQEWLDHKVTQELHKALEAALEAIPLRAWIDGVEEYPYWKHREGFIADLLAWKPDDVIEAEMKAEQQERGLTELKQGAMNEL